MFNMSYQISQNVLLLQETQAATADTLEDRAPKPWGGSAEDITARKETPITHTHTPIDTNICTQSLVADNSHPVIFDCGPLMLDQQHLTHSSVGLGPPGAPLPPQSYFSSAEQTQKSACLKKAKRIRH